MLSLGAAAFTETGDLVDTFSANLKCLEGASGHPDTMKWWGTQPKDIWEACRKDAKDPKGVMADFVLWVNLVSKTQGSSPVCVAYPAGFDWTFIYWYMVYFGQESPFSFSCLDVKSFAMARLKSKYRKTTKKNMPRHWFDGLPPHEHIALSDAIEQGYLFLNILKDHANY